ncbi:uncharacterized protein LOC113769245 [Coffea eugenioides]|uniref:uncharacterized protein LOC113769245 n=1 Tax=Coffea eugenioides TaxID=49369 RepID=UPI000F604F29|nr:uncharacterized protein LOC113769245 [Coffea eugenioides]
MSYFYRRFGETVSHHFHRVLRAIIALEDQFLHQLMGEQVPSEILNSARFYPYYKDCVGAIGGTHVRVKVSSIDAAKYRGRKEHLTQNVLAACKYYLVDVGFMLRRGLLTPYRNFDPDLEYINEADEELARQSPSEKESGDISAEKDHAQGESLRNEIAMQMWNDYLT